MGFSTEEIETGVLETVFVPACPEAMREAARAFDALRTPLACIGGALFARMDGAETAGVEA